jgi:hypothetical protein
MKIKYSKLFPKQKTFELRSEQITTLYVGNLDGCACGCEGTYFHTEDNHEAIVKYYFSLQKRIDEGDELFGHFDENGKDFFLECRNHVMPTVGLRFYVDLTYPIA